MPRIYISYRPIDSHQKAVEQVYNQFGEVFGTENVIRSQQNNNLSTEKLQQQVKQHDLLLVVFGRYGLNMVDESGNLLLADPYDPIHIEIDTALKTRMTIKTLLLDDDKNDLLQKLPEVLRPLANNSVIRVDDLAEIDAIIAQLLQEFSNIQRQSPQTQNTPPDLSKLVVQPTRRPVPSISFNETITSSQSSQPTPSSKRVWLQMSFSLVLIVGLLLFVASIIQNQDAIGIHVEDAKFNLNPIVVLDQGADYLTVSPYTSEVLYITPQDTIWRYNWITMESSEQVRVGILSPNQVFYGIEDTFIIRSDFQIYVIEPGESGYVLNAIYHTDLRVRAQAKILDMAVSKSSPVIVALLNNTFAKIVSS